MYVEDHSWYCQLEFFDNKYQIWEGEMSKPQDVTKTPKSNKCEC